MLRAVLLDAYGTILDTGDGSVKATERILRKHGISLDPVEVYATWKRIHREHVAALAGFETEESLFRRDLERIYQERSIPGDAGSDVAIMLATLGTRTAFPEAARAIAELRRRWRVYVASNSDTAPLEADISRNAIETDGVLCSQALRAYKPGRDFFERALERICCIPEEVVYVGDSVEDDIRGAGSAAIRTVWVNRKGASPSATDVAPVITLTDLSPLASELLGVCGEESVAQPLGCEGGLPVFGRLNLGEGALERPGAYAIIRDGCGRIPLVPMGCDYFLPGGGIERGEDPVTALERELREELGVRPVGVRPLGEAIEYWRSPVSGRFLRTHGHFFTVTECTRADRPAEAGEAPVWLEPAEAVRRLLRPAQQWFAHRHGVSPVAV